MATGSPTKDSSPSAKANGQLWSSFVPELETRAHAPLPQHRGKIVERQHGDDTRHCARRAGVDATDQRMRMRAAHEGRVQRTGCGNVIDETGAAGQQRKILEPWDPRSDQVAHWPSLEIALVARAMTSFGVA